jgi:hypothetical protein
VFGVDIKMVINRTDSFAAKPDGDCGEWIEERAEPKREL